MTSPHRISTAERLDVVAHRGSIDVEAEAPPPAVGETVEIRSSDGRWGLRARVERVERLAGDFARVWLDRRSATMYARPPIDGH
jgi:hypothetical protein